jgi:hypothetical protein
MLRLKNSLVKGTATVPNTKWSLDHGTPTKVERAYMAADWASGRLPFRPSIAEAAVRAGVSPTYAWHALHRQTERAEIIAGRIPLVPPSGSSSSSEARDRKRLARMASKRGFSGVLEMLADLEADVGADGTTVNGHRPPAVFGNGTAHFAA